MSQLQPRTAGPQPVVLPNFLPNSALHSFRLRDRVSPEQGEGMQGSPSGFPGLAERAKAGGHARLVGDPAPQLPLSHCSTGDWLGGALIVFTKDQQLALSTPCWRKLPEASATFYTCPHLPVSQGCCTLALSVQDYAQGSLCLAGDVSLAPPRY